MFNLNLVEDVSFVHDATQNILVVWLLKYKGAWQRDFTNDFVRNGTIVQHMYNVYGLESLQLSVICISQSRNTLPCIAYS